MRNKKGFSLLELMIVIAIIAIVSAVAIPAVLSWLPGYRLRAAVRDLKSDMVLSRLRAIRENASVATNFNTGGNSYTIFLDNGEGGGTASDEIQNGGEVLLKQIAIPNGVIMYGITFGNSRFGFNGRGLPNAIGRVNMRTTGNEFMQIRLSMVGNARTYTSADGVNWFDEWGNSG